MDQEFEFGTPANVSTVSRLGYDTNGAGYGKENLTPMSMGTASKTPRRSPKTGNSKARTEDWNNWIQQTSPLLEKSPAALSPSISLASAAKDSLLHGRHDGQHVVHAAASPPHEQPDEARTGGAADQRFEQWLDATGEMVHTPLTDLSKQPTPAATPDTDISLQGHPLSEARPGRSPGPVWNMEGLLRGELPARPQLDDEDDSEDDYSDYDHSSDVDEDEDDERTVTATPGAYRHSVADTSASGSTYGTMSMTDLEVNMSILKLQGNAHVPAATAMMTPGVGLLAPPAEGGVYGEALRTPVTPKTPVEEVIGLMLLPEGPEPRQLAFDAEAPAPGQLVNGAGALDPAQQLPLGQAEAEDDIDDGYSSDEMDIGELGLTPMTGASGSTATAFGMTPIQDLIAMMMTPKPALDTGALDFDL